MIRLTVLTVILTISLEAKALDVLTVDEAIAHILENGLESHRIGPCPRHPLALDASKRAKLAAAIVAAADAHGVDWSLLVALAFREGSFRHRSKGDLDELSTFQIVPETARTIARMGEDRCNLDNHAGAAHCAAFWLAHWNEKCGSWKGAFSIYIAGRSCKADTSKIRWIIKDRFGIAKKLGNL